MRVGDRVKVNYGIYKDDSGIVECIHSDGNASVKLIEPKDLYGMIIRIDQQFLDVEEKPVLHDALKNVVPLPEKKPKFEHKHQMKINGYYLEFTHKELKELKLLLDGLTNA